MQLAYLGTSDFAARVLRRLAASPHRPALVITPPDRKQGRGRRLSPPPVASAAEALGIPVHQTPNVNEPESLAAIESAGADIGLVCAFGQIIRAELLARLELWNVHPSLLPRWRGAAPIERAILAGDDETGVAIMRVTEGLDSGPVALLERTPIDARENFGALAPRLADLGGELAVRAFELRSRGSLDATPQDDGRATYAEKIEPADQRLDPAKRAVDLDRIVRGLTPHVGAFLELEGGDRLGVIAAEPAIEAGGPDAGGLRGEDGALLLGTADGALRIDVVKPPGKREMAAADYLRGHPEPRLAP